ncbi:MAG: endolytic transglycosylase MltG, partial [Acidobacteriota bacterium]
LLFRVLMKVRGQEGAIQAGEYEFTRALSPVEVLHKLVDGDVLRHKLTVPEGLRLDEIADLVDQNGFGSREGFLQATRRTDLIADIDPDAEDLEGYLFPDTYFFPRGVSEDEIVEEMVKRFRRELTPPRLAQMREHGLNLRGTLTLASLVEKEAQRDDERPRIAAVFYNRLKRGMLLQCDPTVVYALIRDDRYRGAIYRSDLSYDSPYNTYVHAGLPPGPLCSPGLRSLEAVLQPAVTKDLYFVVSGPGRHEFSTNARDHERAVRRYRREMSQLKAVP